VLAVDDPTLMASTDASSGPMSLKAASDAAAQLFSGMQLTVAGWGATTGGGLSSTLQSAQVCGGPCPCVMFKHAGVSSITHTDKPGAGCLISGIQGARGRWGHSELCSAVNADAVAPGWFNPPHPHPQVRPLPLDKCMAKFSAYNSQVTNNM
jgi:hypothetical protein